MCASLTISLQLLLVLNNEGEKLVYLQLVHPTHLIEPQSHHLGYPDIPSGVTVAQLGALDEPVADKQAFLPRYLKRVEAEEKWLETHTPGDESYVEKI